MRKSKILAPLDLKKWRVSQNYGKPLPSTEHFYRELGLFDQNGNPVHNGIDFACPIGTPLVASIDGTVEAWTSSDGALIVRISNDEMRVLYCHLSKFLVKTGDKVKAGDIIGLSGNSGKYTTGAHLHYGVYPIDKNGNYSFKFVKGAVDPVPYLAEILENGELVKNEFEPKVYYISNGGKWWIADHINGEKTFEQFLGYKVGKAKIKDIDLITFNHYKTYGEIKSYSKN